jgi:FLVCR family MFS transporter 7
MNLIKTFEIIGGVIGATASGIFVDKTRRYTETMKVSMALAVFFGLAFLQLSMVRGIAYLILIVCFLFGVMGLAMYPVGLEMSTECTFPVAETTSTGLVVLSGQIQAVIFMAIMTQFSKPLSPEKESYQVCTPSEPRDMRLSIYVCISMCNHLFLFLDHLRHCNLVGHYFGSLLQAGLQANEC